MRRFLPSHCQRPPYSARMIPARLLAALRRRNYFHNRPGSPAIDPPRTRLLSRRLVRKARDRLPDRDNETSLHNRPGPNPINMSDRQSDHKTNRNFSSAVLPRRNDRAPPLSRRSVSDLSAIARGATAEGGRPHSLLSALLFSALVLAFPHSAPSRVHAGDSSHRRRTGPRRRYLVVATIATLMVLFFPALSFASVSPQPGDACTAGQVGTYATNVGALQIPGYFLVCDGSHWNLFESFTTAGSVGIGTSAPATMLDVAGTVRVANGGETCSSTIKGGIRYTSTNLLQYCNSAIWKTISASGSISAAGTQGNIQFNSGGVLAASSTFTFTSAGSLGIGTTTPDNTLEVIGGASIAASGSGTFNAGNIQLQDSNNSNYWQITNRGSSDTGNRNKLLFNFYNGSGWAPEMTLNTSGFLGIGTTSPGAPLVVAGTNSSTTDSTVADLVAIQNLNTGSTSLNTLSFVNAGPYDGAHINYIPTGGATTNVGGALAFATKITSGSTWTEAMRIINGRVGIGTTTPATKLDVAGTLRVANGGETCAAGVAGGIIYQSGSLEYCNATAWKTLSASGSASAAGTQGNIQYNSGGVLAAASTLTYNTTTGNVGIGTAAPTAALDVNGNLVVGNKAGTPNGQFTLQTGADPNNTLAQALFIAGVGSTHTNRIYIGSATNMETSLDLTYAAGLLDHVSQISGNGADAVSFTGQEGATYGNVHTIDIRPDINTTTPGSDKKLARH